MAQQEPVESPMSQSPELSTSSKSPIFIGAIVVAVVVLVLAYTMYRRSPADDVQTPIVQPSTATTTVGSYKDGTYTADGAYTVHAGPEKVTITLTLKDGIVTDSQFQATPNLPMSQRFMDMFANNYKPLVIGKKLSEIHLDKVSGSSYTPIGFNSALEKIKSQAGA